MLIDPSSIVNPKIRRAPRRERKFSRDFLHIEGKWENVSCSKSLKRDR